MSTEADPIPYSDELRALMGWPSRLQEQRIRDAGATWLSCTMCTEYGVRYSVRVTRAGTYAAKDRDVTHDELLPVWEDLWVS